MEEIRTVGESTQFIVIKLGDEQYGIDIKYIDNIVRMQHITRVPKVDDYLSEGRDQPSRRGYPCYEHTHQDGSGAGCGNEVQPDHHLEVRAAGYHRGDRGRGERSCDLRQ